jgi:predicted transcriptional regulator
MTEKGLTTRKKQGQQHLYWPCETEEVTQKRLVGDLLDRAFGGSTARLVMQALATKRATPEELREIRRLLAAKKERPHE